MIVMVQVGLIFFISTYWGMFPLYNALFTFPQEKAILAKERASNMYRLSAYFMARILGDALLNLCLPTLFLIVVYFMAGLKPTASAFILTLVTTFATAISSQVCVAFLEFPSSPRVLLNMCEVVIS
jgi:ABC-type multidrug transport system permease subunit